MYYVYVLESLLTKELYVGSTNDLKKRFKNHNEGKVISTKRYRPWKLIYYEAYIEEQLARMREQKLKHHGNAMRQLKNRIIKNVKNSAGFTLLELLLSMGVLMILIGILTTVFGQILDVQIESKSTSSVTQNGQYIIARLVHDMQSAQTIVSPALPGSQSATLQIRINSVDYIYSASPSGNLVLTNNNGTDVLNSNAASISALTFTRLGNGDSNDTIRVGFTLTSRTQKVGGPEQKNFQTTLGLD